MFVSWDSIILCIFMLAEYDGISLTGARKQENPYRQSHPLIAESPQTTENKQENLNEKE